MLYTSYALKLKNLIVNVFLIENDSKAVHIWTHADIESVYAK